MHCICHTAKKYQKHCYPYCKHAFLKRQIHTSFSPRNLITILVSVNEIILCHIALLRVELILQFSFKGRIVFFFNLSLVIVCHSITKKKMSENGLPMLKTLHDWQSSKKQQNLQNRHLLLCAPGLK